MQFSRDAVVKAAHDVAAKLGVRNITFRAISSASGVGLGTLTYHYRDRAQIIAEATTEARQRFLSRFRSALDQSDGDGGLPRCLAEMVEHMTVTYHAETAVENDFFLTGLDDPALRDLSIAWSAENTDMLAVHMSREQAVIITYQLAGMFLHSAKFGKRFPASETEPLFRSILANKSSTS